MARTLKLSVKNAAGHTITAYSVCHSWDGHSTICQGTNLADGAESVSVEMTSGYVNYDWFTVQLTIDSVGTRQTNFYCNSSSSEIKCIVEVHDTFVNLQYFDAKGNKNGCDKKHYSGEFQDEQDQEDPAKQEVQ